ncbi:unnamed protein product [Pleuronectes platessa]|uniref:Uncharacterized protein n=1 Tax=Pleuronectes platessa TaxID=8262 RepID=A0A9N7V2D5_PLEPL|nr:unnamed protein product [Pleuronectes platessa]
MATGFDKGATTGSSRCQSARENIVHRGGAQPEEERHFKYTLRDTSREEDRQGTLQNMKLELRHRQRTGRINSYLSHVVLVYTVCAIMTLPQSGPFFLPGQADHCNYVGISLGGSDPRSL